MAVNWLQRALDGPTGKRWTLASCLSDHIVILRSHLSALFGAYSGLGGVAIEHDYIEAIMVSTNSSIRCAYCDGLHTELAVLSGWGDAARRLAAATDAASATAAVNRPGVAYARAFGELNMRGPGEDKAYAALVAAEGASRARSIKALCTFLYWGALTGNSLNAAKKRIIGVAPLSGLTPFSLAFFLYYYPLFLVVVVFNSFVIPLFRAAFRERAKSQVWFFKLTGFTLWTLALLWILPVGLLALALSLCMPSLRGPLKLETDKDQ
jgi:hypothetical protein